MKVSIQGLNAVKCPSRERLVGFLKAGIVDAFRSVFGENLVSIVLFGSYARGDFECDSDVDVFVVVDEIGDRFELHKKIDLVEEILKPFFDCLKRHGLNPVLSPIVVDKAMASKTRPLYLDMVFDARILYDREDFMKNVLERVRRKLEEHGAERRRIGRKWVTVLKKEYRFGEVIEI